MRKFRHKPSGEIFTQKNDLEMIGLKDSESDGVTLPTWLLEQSNNWEEIVEYPIHTEEGIKKISNINVKEDSKYIGIIVGGKKKEEKLFGASTMKEEPNYLITAFRDLRKGRDNILYKINSEGNYASGSGFSGIPLIKMLKDGDCVQSGHFEIYSVKNSKGEEFTIGDSVMCEKEKFTISHFNIGYTDINIMMAVFNETNTKLNNLNGSNIELISKVKSPIYTTTDGVDIKEGSHLVLYLVNKELNTLLQNVAVINNFSKQDAEVASRYLTFTSEENRDKYIKENTKKPIFVSADGKEVCEGGTIYNPSLQTGEIYIYKFKLHDTMSGDCSYSSKEAAQEYIDQNKPKYSLADIEKAYESPQDSPLFKSIIKNLKALGK